MPFTENGGADAQQGRALGHGRLEVAGHAHGQLVHADVRTASSRTRSRSRRSSAKNGRTRSGSLK